jgi:hypothetical protein
MDDRRGDDQLVDVEFRLPGAPDATSVVLVGEFNDWSTDVHQLRRQPDGSWSVVVRLPPGRHRFRYLVDGDRWENDWDADAYEPNGMGEDNSVRVVWPSSQPTPQTDVADAEAGAIAATTSAEQTKPDGELVAPTTDTGAPSEPSAPASPGGSAVTTGGPHPTPPEGADDGRRGQQGSGQPSPTMGEQQQSVPPR